MQRRNKQKNEACLLKIGLKMKELIKTINYIDFNLILIEVY